MTRGSPAAARRLVQTLLYGCLFSLTGCSSWLFSGFTQPEVHLTGVEVIKARLLEQKLELTFLVDNPNGYALRIQGLDYQVLLDQVPILEGQSSAWVKVPANGTKEIRVPLRANLWQHGKFVAELLKNPRRPIPYQLHGTLKAGWFFGLLTHRMPLNRSGEITPGQHRHD